VNRDRDRDDKNKMYPYRTVVKYDSVTVMFHSHNTLCLSEEISIRVVSFLSSSSQTY